MRYNVKDSKGRFTKKPTPVNVVYDKQSYVEQLIDTRVRFSREELEEAVREMDVRSPIENAVRQAESLTEARMRSRFNWHYSIWLSSTIIAMGLMWLIGKYV